MGAASTTNATSIACTIIADATNDTTTSTDFIKTAATISIATRPATSTNSTKQITSSTTTSTNAIKTSQLKHPRKSTHKIYTRHENHNITQTNLETLGENGQPCLEKHKTLDYSRSSQENLSRLGQTRDTQNMMVKQEKTRLETIVKNKTVMRNTDQRKKIIFDKLLRHHGIRYLTKSMRNSLSVKKSRKGCADL
ncbi:uncharacterized protein LOC131933320 [Physella acuta]|uniref:uncharacterized protein LOC131933320 n=1 Tax=Physella acuta TaxID=109671 RepID=UPI0027DB8D74|nr:uncharacterized protein LOC131933320 [Physella acuta]